jgi:hypothetical protein
MSVPGWWEAAILALAAWRTFQLLAFDDILDYPRRYVTRLGDFLVCPYCAGAWIAAAWWGAWQAWGDSALVVATPFLLSAGVVAGHKLLSSE